MNCATATAVMDMKVCPVLCKLSRAFALVRAVCPRYAAPPPPTTRNPATRGEARIEALAEVIVLISISKNIFCQYSRIMGRVMVMVMVVVVGGRLANRWNSG